MPGNRREVLFKVFPACALMCAGCGGGAAAQKTADAAKGKHKFSEKSEMTYEQIFGFAYQGFIPLMKGLSEELGKDKFEALLKKVASRTAAEQARQQAAKLGKNDLAAFLAPLKSKDPLWQHVLTFAFVEDTGKAVEVRVTECLWAKTFREAGAADIGYAAICHPDFATAPAFNPKMRMTRTQTLMQGHDCCNHRWTLQA